jgi:NTP pyrophosphatase (non-canonical NTP hydrolase)
MDNEINRGADFEIEFLDLATFQRQVDVWRKYNFPKSLPYQPLLGAVEEMGELVHAHLKQEQGIRGTPEEHQAAKSDAVGDVFVYLAHYCAMNNLWLPECVHNAWNEVKNRDWIKFPTNGVDK